MAKVHSSADARSLLSNKFIVFIGSSVVRTMYKDFVVLLQENAYMTETEMRNKGELAYKGDKLLDGGQLGKMHNGVTYREVREFWTESHRIKFYFATRIYGDYMKAVLKELFSESTPDVIIINSGIWDVNRYGPTGPEQFQRRLPLLLEALQGQVDPDKTVVLFCTSLPVSEDCKGGFLTPETEFMRETLSLQIMAANSAFFRMVPSAGYDILDLHYLLRYHVHRRCEDGIHWDMTAHRRISNLLLFHLSQAWGLSSRGDSLPMQRHPTPTPNMAAKKKHALPSAGRSTSAEASVAKVRGLEKSSTVETENKPFLLVAPKRKMPSSSSCSSLQQLPLLCTPPDKASLATQPKKPASSVRPQRKPSLQQPVKRPHAQRGRANRWRKGASGNCLHGGNLYTFSSMDVTSSVYDPFHLQPEMENTEGFVEEEFHSSWMRRYHTGISGKPYEPSSFRRYHTY